MLSRDGELDIVGKLVGSSVGINVGDCDIVGWIVGICVGNIVGCIDRVGDIDGTCGELSMFPCVLLLSCIVKIIHDNNHDKRPSTIKFPSTRSLIQDGLDKSDHFSRTSSSSSSSFDDGSSNVFLVSPNASSSSSSKLILMVELDFKMLLFLDVEALMELGGGKLAALKLLKSPGDLLLLFCLFGRRLLIISGSSSSSSISSSS